MTTETPITELEPPPCSARALLRVTHLDAFADFDDVGCVVLQLDGATRGELLLTIAHAVELSSRLLDAAMQVRKHQLGECDE
jgi:hypothetical protein